MIDVMKDNAPLYCATLEPQFVLMKASGERTFVTADHHFDHANIIKLCDRPFLNVVGSQ